MARRTRPGLARRRRGRRDGRVHRVQDRHHRGAARRGRGDGPLPRRPPGRRRPGPVPPPGPAGPSTATAAARATRSTAPGGPCTPAPTCSPTSRRDRLDALFADDDHVEVEATWGIYQRMIAAYREPDRADGPRADGRADRRRSATASPAALTELITLGRTLKKRAADVLAYFDRPGTSNGPTEAINGRLEHLRGSALGFRNLTNYIARSPTRDRRIQTPTTPSIVKSRFSVRSSRRAEDRQLYVLIVGGKV